MIRCDANDSSSSEDVIGIGKLMVRERKLQQQRRISPLTGVITLKELNAQSTGGMVMGQVFAIMDQYIDWYDITIQFTQWQLLYPLFPWRRDHCMVELATRSQEMTRPFHESLYGDSVTYNERSSWFLHSNEWKMESLGNGLTT